MAEQPNPSGRLPPKFETHVDAGSVDADQIMIIPDSPDKIPKQRRNARRPCIAAGSASRNSGLVSRDYFGKKGQIFGDNAQELGGQSHCWGNPGGIVQNQVAGGSVAPYVVKNAPLATMTADKTTKHTGRHNFNLPHVENEKVSQSRLSGTSHPHKKNNSPVIVENGLLAKSFKNVGQNVGAEEMREGFLPANNGVSLQSVGKSTINERKGKMKVGYDKPCPFDALPTGVHDNTSKVAFNHDAGKMPSTRSQPIRTPSINSRKRLVRNGYINPCNIAKTRQLADNSVNGTKNVDSSTPVGSCSVIDLDEVTAKDNAASKAKGKGVAVCSAKGYKDRKEINIGNPEDSVVGKRPLPSGATASETLTLPSVNLSCTPSTSYKRQMRHDSTSHNPEKSAEVICLSSGGESLAEMSTMGHGPQRSLGSSVGTAELSLEGRESESQMETRDIQLQADELLARELQEELYNEILEAPSYERDYITWGHQEGDNIQHTSSRRSSHRRTTTGSPAPNTRRQFQSQSLHNRLFQRGRQARIPTSNVSRARSRINSGLSLAPSGERNVQFPSYMNMERRIELLEALEAVVSSDIGMVNQLLDSDREFNEDDYEMLLSLDENNHEHLGASVSRIANLPESTVQNDNSEACSICLETPAVGDTMRHLPCLHKFHKDCIDPWLRRKRSCPVCKSDV